MYHTNKGIASFFSLFDIFLNKFDFKSYPFKLSGKVVNYICPKCKHKFEVPIKAVLEFESEDEMNGLPISTPPYTICSKCNYQKCVPIDYKSKRGYHHIHKEN